MIWRGRIVIFEEIVGGAQGLRIAIGEGGESVVGA